MCTEQSYAVVFKDLEDRHRKCQEEVKRATDELNMLTQMLASLRQFMPNAQQDLPLAPQAHSVHDGKGSPGTKNGIYSGLSTRWAILYLLAENATSPMGRSEIAKALTDGGITSAAQSFASNVSAVLSGMANERKEVEQEASGGYQITDHGRDVWEGVKRTPQWNSRVPLAA